MNNSSNNHGFTLVEILIVTVIMGLVITSVYSLFLSSQRTAYTSEEVVDVQQNLRVALDTMVSDIRMAGFLIADDNFITTEPDIVYIAPDRDTVPDSGETFSFRMRSSMKNYARVVNVVNDPTDGGVFVEGPMAASFRENTDVMIIRPSSLVVVGVWPLDQINGDFFKLNDYASGASVDDVVVRKLAGEDTVVEIMYWLRPAATGGTNNFELMRSDGVVNSVIASNITQDGLELEGLDSTGNVTTDVNRILAVRISITGETDDSRTGLANFSGVKQRRLQTVAKIRNAI